jgi:hypothetical protein
MTRGFPSITAWLTPIAGFFSGIAAVYMDLDFGGSHGPERVSIPRPVQAGRRADSESGGRRVALCRTAGRRTRRHVSLSGNGGCTPFSPEPRNAVRLAWWKKPLFHLDWLPMR